MIKPVAYPFPFSLPKEKKRYDASSDDHRLDLYCLETQHWWQILGLLPTWWNGRHTPEQGIRVLHATDIEVYTRKPRAINTDGEITPWTSAQFRVIPEV